MKMRVDVVLFSIMQVHLVQSTHPPAPPAPEFSTDNSAFYGCYFFHARACANNRDPWRMVGEWQHDLWGMENGFATASACTDERPSGWNTYCYGADSGHAAPFAFQYGGILAGSYDYLAITGSHAVYVAGFDVQYKKVNISAYPLSADIIVRSNTLTATTAYIGDYNRHHGVVRVHGGSLIVTGDAYLGRYGFGELYQTGGYVNVSTMHAASEKTGTSFIHQTGGDMTVDQLNLGSANSYAHMLIEGGSVTAHDLVLMDDYPQSTHATRIVVKDGGVLTVLGALKIEDHLHDQVHLKGGNLIIAAFWKTSLHDDMSTEFVTMYRGSTLMFFASAQDDDNPCDATGTLTPWYEKRFVKRSTNIKIFSTKHLRPVLGEHSGYNLSYSCVTTANLPVQSATGYGLKWQVVAS